MSKERDHYCTRCRDVKPIKSSTRRTSSSCNDCGTKTTWARVDHKGGSECIVLIFALLFGFSLIPLATCHKDKQAIQKQYEPGEKNPNFTEEDAPENTRGDSTPRLPEPASLPD